MNKTIQHLFCCLLLILSASCSTDEGDQDSDYGNDKNGYALKQADGHSFQFYNSTKWLFSVAVRNNKVTAKVQSDRTPYGTPSFSYDKTGKNTAECWISVGYKFLVGGQMIYGGYIARGELKFTSAKGGTYQLYDVSTDKPGSSGKFTVDED